MVRMPKPLKSLRYSPLCAHFLKSQHFSTTNSVQPVKLQLSEGEAFCEQMKDKSRKKNAQQLLALSNQLMANYHVMAREGRRCENELIEREMANRRLVGERK